MKTLAVITLAALAGLTYASSGPIIAPLTREPDVSKESDKPTVRAECVKPGETHSNGDVEVANDEGSGGNISVDPGKNAEDSTSSTITFENRASGSVTGIEGGDMVIMKNASRASITGTGGVVMVTGPMASGTVTHAGAANSPPILVQYRNSFYVYVNPGQTVPFGSN